MDNFGWAAIDRAYVAECELADASETAFKEFRRGAAYRTVVETVTDRQALKYFFYIGQAGKLHTLFRFRENDRIGNPEKFLGFSPTTLRYILTWARLEQEFGSLQKFHIAEIGGGFGGQCNILSLAGGFSSYTIFEIPAAKKIVAKFLAEVPSVSFEPKPRYDLVISNYAFSELDRAAQDEYIKTVISTSDRGYITYNWNPSDPNRYDKKEIIEVLSRHHKLRVSDEHPRTGTYNFVIAWG